MNSRLLVIICFFLLPDTLFAATQCRIVELPDRYEAICEGDEKILVDATVTRNPSQAVGQKELILPVEIKPQGMVKVLSSEKAAEKGKVLSPALQRLVAYRQNKLQRSSVEAKKLMRMQKIQAERQSQPDHTEQQLIEEM